MNILSKMALCVSLGALAGCADGYGAATPDKSVDRGYDGHHISDLTWGIWVDPQGCDNWIADDGIEGYMVRRLDKYGKPICSGVAEPTFTAGNFKEGDTIGDPN